MRSQIINIMEGQTTEKKEEPKKKEEDEIDKEYKQIVSNFPEEVKARFAALKVIAVLYHLVHNHP